MCYIIQKCGVISAPIIKVLSVSPYAPEKHLIYINIYLIRTINYAFKQYLGGKLMSTYMASASNIERKWYVVDAADYTLGRLASQVAAVLRGKNKPTYTPFLDCGDNVIVINAEKIKVTGKKLDQKIYYNHSDYVGGMKETTLKEMMEKHPERVIELAVKGMLPKGPLGRQMYTKLHVYAGPDHEQAAQKPEVLKF